MTGRRALAATALVAGVLAIAAACGGGPTEPSAVEPVDAGIPAPTGVDAGASSVLAVAALGVPGAPDAGAAARTLSGYDAFGAPRDVFAPGVRESSDASRAGRSGAGSTSSPGATTTTTPALTVPDVPVATAPVVPAAPAATAPVAPAAPAAPPAAPEPEASGWRSADPAIVPAPGSAAGRLALRADLEFGGVTVTARAGDAVPPGTQRFTVVSITATEVVLRLDGAVLPDGGDVLTLELGQEVSLQDPVSGATEHIALVGIRAG